MKNEISGLSYDLIDFGQGLWGFYADKRLTYSGSFLEVVLFSMRHFGFLIGDIEQGVEMMLVKDHNSINFGVYKTPVFTYSYNSKAA